MPNLDRMAKTLGEYFLWHQMQAEKKEKKITRSRFNTKECGK